MSLTTVSRTRRGRLLRSRPSTISRFPANSTHVHTASLHFPRIYLALQHCAVLNTTVKYPHLPVYTVQFSIFHHLPHRPALHRTHDGSLMTFTKNTDTHDFVRTLTITHFLLVSFLCIGFSKRSILHDCIRLFVWHRHVSHNTHGGLVRYVAWHGLRSHFSSL